MKNRIKNNSSKNWIPDKPIDSNDEQEEYVASSSGDRRVGNKKKSSKKKRDVASVVVVTDYNGNRRNGGGGASNVSTLAIIDTDSKHRSSKALKKSSSEPNLNEEFQQQQEVEDCDPPKPRIKRTSRITKSSINLANMPADQIGKKKKRSNSSGNLSAGKTKTCVKNNNLITIYERMPRDRMAPLDIINQDQAKKKFLESNIAPVLKFNADKQKVKQILRVHSKARYQHLFQAKWILDAVKAKFPRGVHTYYEANFGKKLTSDDQCINLVGKYLKENDIDGEIEINFAPGLACSGRINHYGMENNDPSTRKFVVWINNDKGNHFLREDGIVCLCDHEIGTHYYRSFNDGLQVWFKERRKNGLRPLQSRELIATEEGLAALNTLMSANLKYLYLPAMLYYLAAMASRMTFEQLFNHMERYIASPDKRWKMVTRVKRGISDPNKVGCYSRDQSYFEGAINILENLDDIDFRLLYSGKLCLDELDVVRDFAQTDGIKTPKFLNNIKAYKNKLRQIGVMNGILGPNKRASESVSDQEVKQYIDSVINESKSPQPATERTPRVYAEDEDESSNGSTFCSIL